MMTKENKIKNLTLAELKKQNKKLDAVREFKVDIDGEVYKLTHDIHFRKTKQQKVLEDMIMFFDNGMNRIEILDVASPYMSLLVMKHFTSLEVSDDIDEALALMSILIDLGKFNEILGELPEEELTKMYELLAGSVENLRDTLEAMETEANTIASKVENPEVKEMLENGKASQ